MRILHAPINVGNQPWVLSQYERKQGHKSELIVNYSTSFNYPADRVLSKCGDKTKKEVVRRFATGIAAPFKYDVLHYYFGRSLLYWDDWAPKIGFPFFDLRLAKWLGKKIFFTLQGCDVRLAGKSNKKNIFTPCREGNCEIFSDCINRYDQQRQRFIEAVLPFCDKVFYLNPELGHFIPNGHFLPYTNFDIDNVEPLYPDAKKRKPRVVHAPTDSAIKGTPLILEALHQLSEQFEFDLIIVQGKTNEEALEIYRTADIAIDQVLAGWYGGVGVEFMAMGKPVLCYLRESDFRFVPKQMIADLPIRNVRPDHLVEDLRMVFEKRDEWREWGMASRQFVEKWHNPATWAHILLEVYQNPSLPWSFQE